jgi:hypothetical protein
MFPNLCGLIGVGILVTAMPVSPAERLDQLFTSWEGCQRDVHSLVVEFTREEWDPVFETRREFDGTFKLLRTRTGDVFASYEDSENSPVRYSGLISGGTIYILERDTKTALKFEPADQNVIGFMNKYFNPFVLLLDRKLAQEQYRLEIVQQDKCNTYLTMKPKQVETEGVLPADVFREGQATLVNQPTNGIPKDMPKQLWYTTGVFEYTFKIRAWHLNAADAPRLHDFKKPEERTGWTVLKWE